MPEPRPSATVGPVREWATFPDPDDADRRWLVDVTFLTSPWRCLFGCGCQGVLTAAAPEMQQGCCSYGAHFNSEEDRDRVLAVVGDLRTDEWQHARAGLRRGVTARLPQGGWRTRLVDGACVFLNRPGAPAGSGCALHSFALRTGESHVRTKPDVCWQLPLRRTFRDVELPDGETYLEVSIGEYDRRGWGPGGHDLDWYCSGNPEAHVGREPVFRSNAGELRELMGPEAYDELVVRCEAHLRSRSALALHPADPR